MAEEKSAEKETPKKEDDMMASEENYMTSGAHIGTRQKTADIKDCTLLMSKKPMRELRQLRSFFLNITLRIFYLCL